MDQAKILHEIRLREPWKLDRSEAEFADLSVSNNEGCGTPKQYHSLWFTRSFHSPTGLTPNEKVVLSLATRSEELELKLIAIELNSQQLDDQIILQTHDRWKLELGDLLKPFNAIQLGVQIQNSDPNVKLTDLLDARLQIVASA